MPTFERGELTGRQGLLCVLLLLREREASIIITAGMVVERKPCVRGKMSENAMWISKATACMLQCRPHALMHAGWPGGLVCCCVFNGLRTKGCVYYS